MEYIQGLLSSFITDQAMVKWAIYLVAASAGVTLAIACYYLYSGIYSPIREHIDKLKNQPSSANY
ncbi:MAG: type II secretion system F family protein, partial [Colwellia sp.]